MRHPHGLIATNSMKYFYFMKHISILIPRNAILGSIEGPRQLLTQVNQVSLTRGLPEPFSIQLVGLEKETMLNGSSFIIRPHVLIEQVHSTDLIIIPAVDGSLADGIENNREFLPWITKHYKQGAEVASLCMGAFILAATGLLRGRKCATHWIAEEQFRKMFPDVKLMSERVITDEGGIYSSGGAYSYLNLVLYLIEKYSGRDMAVLCAKIFAIEIERDTQSPFIIFRGQKEHEDQQVKLAQTFIENNFQERITVDQLASQFALGRRNLERRFKKATSNTVVEYIQRVKIEAAKARLETSRQNVNEVMYEAGYSDTKAFRTTFKKITGLSPIEYRKKYNRELVM
jgi:transcriptional regulator GlxA family with amidase domain